MVEGYKVFEPPQHSIIIRKLESGEFEAYIQEMPTVRATGKTRSLAFANCIMLTLDRPNSPSTPS